MKAKYLVLHPGSATGQDKKVALDQIVYGINKAFEISKVKDIYICLETMAGKGTEIGSTFQEIKYILDNTKDKTFVCFDTCHVYDAGYDLKDNYENVMKDFDEVIGINNIKVFHINDSKHGLNSHKDRHANIGYGFLGYEAIYKICHDQRFLNVPKILETPYYLEKPYYKKEIELITSNK
jgi:deoxyribonuclease IV